MHEETPELQNPSACLPQNVDVYSGTDSGIQRVCYDRQQEVGKGKITLSSKQDFCVDSLLCWLWVTMHK